VNINFLNFKLKTNNLVERVGKASLGVSLSFS